MKKTIILLSLCLLAINAMADKTPKVAKEIKKVAILETVDKTGRVSYPHKLMLRTNLAKAITEAEGYEGYDRTDLDALLGEQTFQRTGMVTAEQIKRVGELTGAQFVLVAEAVMADSTTIFATAKIIDVETAQTIKAESQLMSATPKDIQLGCTTLAGNLLGISLKVGITRSASATTKRSSELTSASSQNEKSDDELLEDNNIITNGERMDLVYQVYDGNYRYKGQLISKKEGYDIILQDIMINKNYETQTKLKKSKQLILSGWCTFGIGLATIMGACIPIIANPHGWSDEIDIPIMTAGGAIMAGVSVPLLCVGYQRRDKAIKEYVESPSILNTAELRLQVTNDGLGFAIAF